jgi:hypothetical protein
MVRVKDLKQVSRSNDLHCREYENKTKILGPGKIQHKYQI